MNNTGTLVALIAGATMVIHGTILNTDDILRDAKHATNQTNLHQLATVLELYHLDHNTYPNVEGGEKLIDVLYREGYLRTKPLDASTFIYLPKGPDNFYIALREE